MSWIVLLSIHSYIDYFRHSYVDYFMQDPLCNTNHYYIILAIALTFWMESFTKFNILKDFNFIKSHSAVPRFRTIFLVDVFLAFSLIIVDMIKIVFDWDVACGFNVDTIIKFFLCANILTLPNIFLIASIEIREIFVKKDIIEPSYPPEETTDLTSDVKDRQAIP